jgi:poly-gamma-glutamate synthesis protein (capsule biosynthesis protein)
LGRQLGGYDISSNDQQFAHKLIDEAGVDAIYGHSSHHVKGIEVYKEKLILYGCGDQKTRNYCL